jgi:hypothetical protein
VHNEVRILRKAHCKFYDNNSKQRNSYLPNLQSKMATTSKGRCIMTTKEQALELFDAGIPNEIEDSFYKSMLNGHRWGWHQTPFMLCPACDRNVGA